MEIRRLAFESHELARTRGTAKRLPRGREKIWKHHYRDGDLAIDVLSFTPPGGPTVDSIDVWYQGRPMLACTRGATLNIFVQQEGAWMERVERLYADSVGLRRPSVYEPQHQPVL